jgi:DNA-binding response OmpR family regulator
LITLSREVDFLVVGAARSELHQELAGATLLLVEADPNLAESIAATLSASGCTVWHAESGADARAMIRRAAPDAIILDLSLPDVDGLVLCPRLRAEAGDVPVLVCSDSTDRHWKLLAFHVGAEDFLSKPFDVEELQARLAVALRRRNRGLAPTTGQASGGRSSLLLGGLAIDVPGWRVSIDGRQIHLTPTEFRLLLFVARRSGEFVGRAEIARELWGDPSMSGSRTIDAYMRRVRNKLVGKGTPQLLHVRGLGYQLVPST